MKRKSKRELVLDIYDNEAMGEVTAREIAVINQALIEEYGEGGAMTPAEIARILHDEDLPVRFDQVFRMMTTTEKYENAFARFLENDDFTEAEKSIRGIDELYRKYKQAGDRAGMRIAFEAARTARQNAIELTQLSHLSTSERREQAEAVVDDDGVAGEVQRARDGDAAGVRREDDGAGRTEEVGAAVSVPWLAVEHAARAEGAVRRLRHRPHELLAPQPLGRRRLPDLV